MSDAPMPQEYYEIVAHHLPPEEPAGPSPVDRRQPGTKYTLMVDRNDVPRAVRIAGANRSDQREVLPIIQEDFPEVGGQPGRPTTRPAKSMQTPDTTAKQLARSCDAWLGIEPFIRRRGEEHGSGLGRARWVVERSLACLKGLRRLRLRYDRSPTPVRTAQCEPLTK